MWGWFVGGGVFLILAAGVIWDHLRSKRRIGVLEAENANLEDERDALMEALERASIANPGERQRDDHFGVYEEHPDPSP